MTYLVIEASNNGSATAKAVHEHREETEARMHFHQVMASAMANANVKWAYSEVVTEYGTVIESERYEKVTESLVD